MVEFFVDDIRNALKNHSRLICESALSYYHDNMEKFRFNFSIATEEELFGKNRPMDSLSKDDDPIKKNNPETNMEKKPVPDKEEQRFRSFFGRTFPEKKYKEKKVMPGEEAQKLKELL